MVFFLTIGSAFGCLLLFGDYLAKHMEEVNKKSCIRLVAKILFDQELFDLQKENKKLKLSIFWSKHSLDALCEKMEIANRMLVNCTCVHCFYCGRSLCGNFNEVETCLFKSWFEKLLAECKLTTLFIERGIGCDGLPVCQLEHESNGDVLDVDAHLVMMDAHCWTCFTYGSRLVHADSVQDPELQKLAKLFEALSEPHF